MEKKGQISQIQSLIVPLVGIAIILVVGFLIFSEMKSQVVDIQSGDWCDTSIYLYNVTGTTCCNLTGCPSVYTLNLTDTAECCNITPVTNCTTGHTIASVLDCNSNNTAEASFSYAYNGTSTTQKALDDIPGWIPIIVVAVIGAILIGLVQLFRSR